VKKQKYHLMMEEREAIANRHAETLALIRMGLKHLIDFAASILK
jgi:hypothetical protein